MLDGEGRSICCELWPGNTTDVKTLLQILGRLQKRFRVKYKQLWMVEQIFRSMKSILATRPIFHKLDETIRGYVFCSFLASVLAKEL